MTSHIEMQKHEIAAENNAMEDMTAVIGKLIKRVVYIVACILLLLMTGKWPRQKTGAELALERVRAKQQRRQKSRISNEAKPELAYEVDDDDIKVDDWDGFQRRRWMASFDDDLVTRQTMGLPSLF